MVFGEDLPALYHAFHDRLADDGKEQKLIKCQICCIENIPSYSTGALVCEMCFDDDFWEKMEEIKRDRTDMLWAIKTVSDGAANGAYFAKGQYLGIGLYTNSVDSLGQARLFQTKTEADGHILALQDTERLTNKSTLKLPELNLVQILISEI